MDDGLKATLLGLWMALFVVFAGRKFTQPIKVNPSFIPVLINQIYAVSYRFCFPLKDDIGDKSVFIFNSLPEEEKKLLIEKLERQNYADNLDKRVRD